MATITHSQLGAITAAQFAALPPHLQLQNSELLPNELLLNNPPVPPHVAQSIGLGSLTSGQVLQVLHGHTRLHPPTRPKRALNSWMAFRSFYARIFSNLQQKDTSGHLKKLWQEDPFKAKWTIVAKAYSRIRDLVGKDQAPLDGFLNLACPAIGIIGVEDYLSKMDWSMQVGDNGFLNLQRSAVLGTPVFEQRIIHTSMTDLDLIAFVARQGYISIAAGQRLTQNLPPAQSGGLLASATAFQYVALPVHHSVSSSDDFLQTAANDPVTAASMVLGFDVNDMLNAGTYEWTGSMSDLYNPAAGSIDFQSLTSNGSTDTWGTANIEDPLGFTGMFEGAVEGGYITPDVPDDEGPSYW